MHFISNNHLRLRQTMTLFQAALTLRKLNNFSFLKLAGKKNIVLVNDLFEAYVIFVQLKQLFFAHQTDETTTLKKVD